MSLLQSVQSGLKVPALKINISGTGTITGNTRVNMIGARILSDNPINYANGSIGPIHMYNRALSANEVLHNYNALKGRFS